MVVSLARSRAGHFPIRSAFPNHLLGRRPHCRFRGLLELHAHYGLPGCLPAKSGLYHEVSPSPVSRTDRSIAIESNHQLFEWVLPPLVICPFGAHRRLSDRLRSSPHPPAYRRSDHPYGSHATGRLIGVASAHTSDRSEEHTSEL